MALNPASSYLRHMQSKHLLAPLLVVALGLTACASTESTTTKRKPDAFGDAVSQPFRDLSLVRRLALPVLTRAAVAPYSLENLNDCPALKTEIAALDAALGPDLDAPDTKERSAVDELFSDAVGNAVELPYRGIIRKITGAEKRDRRIAKTVVAGLARRSFLKGVYLKSDCPPMTAG